MAICPRCGTEHRKGTPCPVQTEAFDEAQLLEAYDEFMENRDEDALTEEEEARKDGGSYKGFYWFLIAFGVFLAILIVAALLW